MSRPLYAPLAAAVLLANGCLDTGTDSNAQTFDFNFINAGADQAWGLGVADFPVARQAEVGVVGDLRPLPASLGTPGNAHYQSGNNVSGDLFIFQQMYLTGLRPLASFRVSLQASFVTNYHTGCTTGPGPLVVIKAGMVNTEPRAEPDAQGVYRMNIDKGAGIAAGNFVQLGDIRNGLSGCPATGTFAERTTSRSDQPVDIVTDSFGGFYLFVGTQSSFAGQHEIYFTHLLLTVR